MVSKFLLLFKPAARIMPEVKQPDREVSFKEKLLWTAVALIIYLVMSNTPLYGVELGDQADYFYWMRVILASSRGTLTELGIGPIVTSGLIMQLLVGSKIINVNMSDPVERGMFTGVQKVMSIILTIFQAVAYLAGGAFGSDLTTGIRIVVFMQLIAATVLIMLLDEMLQKGWGLGSGVSLFIASNVAGQIIWNMFSYFPNSGDTGDSMPRGAIITFFTAMFDPNSELTVGQTFVRTGGAPGMMGFFTTILIFLLVIYIESMRIEIPLSYAGYSGFKGKYPMKLMYVSNIPVILSQALYANVLFFTQIIAGPAAAFRQSHPNWDPFLNLLGRFSPEMGAQGQYTPTGGLAFYLTPPQGLSAIITGETTGNVLIHSIVYLAIFVTLCVYLGKIWVEVSGLAPRDIAGQILGSKMQIDGFRRSDKIIEKILKRYIPTLTILNGMIVGFVSFFADFLGALGSGTGLLLMVGIMQNYAETIAKEAAAEQYPAMRGFLGLT